MSTIKTRMLAHEIMRQLGDYKREVIDAINDVGEVLTQEAVKDLRAASAQTFAKKRKRKRSKRYEKGWTVRELSFFNAPTRFTIHNKDRYQLAHLLEKGHANRDGSRTEGTPHIKPIEEQLVEAYVKGVEEAIKGG